MHPGCCAFPFALADHLCIFCFEIAPSENNFCRFEVVLVICARKIKMQETKLRQVEKRNLLKMHETRA